MNLKLPKFRSSTGFGLIEALISLGILLLLFHALSSLIIAAYDLFGNARTRTTARHLGNAKMEEIRNLPYEDIGLIGGIPPGFIQATQVITANGMDYTIRTSVIFIDDPFDQLAPTDPNPSDYKRVRVEVSWEGRFTAGKELVLVSDFSGEEPTGGGLLSVLVFDANAFPVPQADIHILNTSVTPQIDTTLQSDDQGRATLPGAPVCSSCYQITVSKDSYSTDRTYSTGEIPNPNKPHATIIKGQITQIAFTIDKTSNMSISSTQDRSFNFSVLPSKTFRLTGTKTIGTDNASLPIYKYDQLLQTDAGANLSLPNMEWDSYRLTLDPGSWDLAGANPLSPISTLPDSSLNILFASSSHQTDTLLLSVTDATGSAIASASAHLTGPGNYDETIFTGETSTPDFGQAFFSPLSSGSYTASISKSGYQPATESINISQQTQYSIPLNPL